MRLLTLLKASLGPEPAWSLLLISAPPLTVALVPLAILYGGRF